MGVLKGLSDNLTASLPPKFTNKCVRVGLGFLML